MKIAVQLYSVRDHIKTGEDMLDVLAKVKEIGYDGVEFAGYFGLDAQTLRNRLDEVGLVCVGGHIGIDNFAPDKIAETLDFQETLGTKLIGTGGAPHDKPDELAATCEVFENGQRIADERGFKLYYHNHSSEFNAFDTGKRPIDFLRESAWLEIDTYWSFHAGQDNYALLTDMKDKIVHLHVKDGVDGKPRALGEGNCDLATVVKAAKDIGIEWLIVENDDPTPNGLEDIARSIKHLKTLL